MNPELGAVVGVAITGGIAITKIIDRFWPQNGNGKVEILLARLVELAEEDRKDRAETSRSLALMQREMEQHEKRESQAWRDAFELLRK